MIDGAAFLGRLMNPADALTSPPGQSAQDQLISAGSRALDYARTAVDDPRRVGRDVRQAYYKFEADNDPNATPEAPTIAGEAARRFGIGQNQGELGFGLATTAFGGPGLKGLGLLGDVGKAGRVAKYVAEGLSAAQIAEREEAYIGMGHHVIPRRYKLPAWLGGGPLPSAVMDSPFNVLKPLGITKGEMRPLHYQVDPHLHGGPLPRSVGGGRGKGSGWSGRRMGLSKYGILGRVWHGTPDATRLTIGAAGVDDLANDRRAGGT